MTDQATPSAGQIADQASRAYLDRLTENGRCPTYARTADLNPYPPESREADLFDYAWGWAHLAETQGRSVALDHADAKGPFTGFFGRIFEEAKTQTLRQFGRID